MNRVPASFPTACGSPYYNLESLGVTGLMPKEMLIKVPLMCSLRRDQQVPLAAFQGWLV